MASGDGTSDRLRREEHTRTKSLGKATEENEMSAALDSQSGPEKNQNPKILSTRSVAQDLTFAKGKQALQDSKWGHASNAQNKQSLASRPTGSFRGGTGIFPSSNEERNIASGSSSSTKEKLIQVLRETDSQIDDPDPAQSNLERVAANVALTGSTAVEPSVGSVVALVGKVSLEPNGAPLVVLNDVSSAEPNVGPIVTFGSVAPAQSNVAHIVAPSREALVQPNIAPNVAPPPAVVVDSSIVPRRVAPVQPRVAPHAQRNGAPPAPVQPNAALIVAPPVVALVQPNAAAIVAPPAVALVQPNAAAIVAPPAVALVQPNAAAIVAPPAIVVLDVNRGLMRSRLKRLRVCEIGSEGHFWPKL